MCCDWCGTERLYSLSRLTRDGLFTRPTDTQKGKTDTDTETHRQMLTLREMQWYVWAPRLNTWIETGCLCCHMKKHTWKHTHTQTHSKVIGQATKIQHAHYIHMCGWHQSFGVCHLRNAAECLPRSLFFSRSDTNIHFYACSYLLEAPGTLRSTAETLRTRSDISRPTHAVTCRKWDEGRGVERCREREKKETIRQRWRRNWMNRRI